MARTNGKVSTSSSDLAWADAVQLAGCISKAELLDYLTAELPDIDVTAFKQFPARFSSTLNTIRERIANAPKQLQEAPKPVTEPEIPLLEEFPQARVTDLVVNKPSQLAIDQGDKQTKADQIKESQALVLQEVGKVKKATSQRKAKAKNNDNTDKKNRQTRGRLKAVADVAIEQAAYEEVLDAFESKRQTENEEDFAYFLENINASLKNAGAKIQVMTDEDVEQLQERIVKESEVQSDFFEQLGSLW